MLSMRTHVGVDGTDLRYNQTRIGFGYCGVVYLVRGMPRYESKSHV